MARHFYRLYSFDRTSSSKQVGTAAVELLTEEEAEKRNKVPGQSWVRWNPRTWQFAKER